MFIRCQTCGELLRGPWPVTYCPRTPDRFALTDLRVRQLHNATTRHMPGPKPEQPPDPD